jgi:F-type H+-transporting ATPase subunit b
MFLATLAAIAAEGAEKAETINPVVPDEVGEIFWGALAFFSLWALMRYALLPPLLRVREQRAHQEIADLEAAAAAEEQAEQVRRDYDATMAEARAEATAILEEARAAAEAERGRKVAAAESEVAARRQAAMADLEQARAEALRSLRGDVTDLAVTAASKVVQSDLDPAAHRGTVETYVEGAR